MTKALLVVLALLFSCNNQGKKNENRRVVESERKLTKTENSPSPVDTTLEKARWYFYAYASTLKIYTHSQMIVNAMECEIQTNAVKKIGSNTTKVYFSFFYKDTLDRCWSNPYGINGITIIKQKLYVPIYHVVKFDYFKKERLIRANMKKQEENLIDSIKGNKAKLGSWLKSYVSKSIHS